MNKDFVTGPIKDTWLEVWQNSEEIQEKVKYFDTTLRRLKEHEFDLIYQHGWEVANFTLLSRCPEYFSHMGI